MQTLYREVILDHAQKPRNFGPLANATHAAEGINPLCGDKLHLYVYVSDDRIENVSFEGSGCAISMASASLLTETLSQVSVREAADLVHAVTARLTQDESAPTTLVDLSRLRALDGVRQHPSRVKCATLAWKALQAALDQSPTTATTE